MKDYLIITAPTAPIHLSVKLPSSKSISNRVLIMAALGHFRHALKDISDAGDTHRLDHLVNERPQRMDCGAGGTTFRFLLAWAAVQEGEDHLITGIPRLLERPHEPLVDALLGLGASIERVAEGYRVRGRRPRGGEVVLESPVSSQFISALLMTGPYMENGLRVVWRGERISEPYVRMTCTLMQQFGVDVDFSNDVLQVKQGAYSCGKFVVPGDWSAASFWYEIAALAPDARIQLLGMHDDGVQGDVAAGELWKEWVISEAATDGTVLRQRIPTDPGPRQQFDLAGTPDLFQPLLFTCAGKGVAATFQGLHNLPLKETDRLNACTQAIRSLGGTAEYGDGRFMLDPWQLLPAGNAGIPVLDPQGDHRMAMALAPLSLVIGSVAISDPQVVEKSYPSFWSHMEMAGFRLEHITR